MADSLFSASHLTCVRGQRLVFAGLGFELKDGDALLLVGSNGSGKSSLLRLMALLLRPWQGALLWEGLSIADDPDRHRSRLRYVGHTDGVKPVLTTLETLTFWAALDGLGLPERRARRALAGFGLDGIADVPGRFLSAGQKRRLNLARLLLGPARLWLLDEPTNGLDEVALGQLASALATHRAQGGIVVLASHAGLALPAAVTLCLEDFKPRMTEERA